MRFSHNRGFFYQQTQQTIQQSTHENDHHNNNARSGNEPHAISPGSVNYRRTQWRVNSLDWIGVFNRREARGRNQCVQHDHRRRRSLTGLHVCAANRC